MTTVVDLAPPTFPSDLTGWSVLDIGGFNGWATKECMDRGATNCTIVDSGQWRQYEWRDPGRPDGIRYVEMDFLDYNEPADLVLFGNVLYHLQNPEFGLRHLRTLTTRMLILWTSFADHPKGEEIETGWRYYKEGMGHPNGTVWCRPTREGLPRALARAGFENVTIAGRSGDDMVVTAT